MKMIFNLGEFIGKILKYLKSLRWTMLIISPVLLIVVIFWGDMITFWKGMVSFGEDNSTSTIKVMQISTDIARQLLLLSAFSGLISMMILQTFKYIFRWTGYFHYRELSKLFEGTNFFQIIGIQSKEDKEVIEKINPRKFFDMPLEQLMAIIGNTTEQAILQNKTYSPE